MRKLLLLISVGGTLLSQAAGQPLSADTVVFSNGGTLEGQVISEDGQQVIIAVDGGNITVQRSEIASIVKEQEHQTPETLQSYGQKMARWMDDFRDTNRAVIETASSLSNGLISASATVQAFEQYQQGFSLLKQQLDRLVPPPELTGVHTLLLQATESKVEACRWFEVATQRQDDALYEKASSHQKKSKELMEEAVEQFDATLGIAQ